MFRRLNGLSLRVFAAVASTAAFLSAGANPQKDSPKASLSSETGMPEYFPKDSVDGWADFFSFFLNTHGEPSLLAAAKDPNALSYRFEWMSGQHGNLLSVRLSLSPDGNAQIIAIAKPSDSGASTSQRSVSNEDLKKLLQLLEEAKFWSMPTDVDHDPNQQNRVKKYVIDGSPWILEGVRNGGYHVVYGGVPNQSPLRDVIFFLTKDLARLSDSFLPIHSLPRKGTGGGPTK
jgi:hypothetical protein